VKANRQGELELEVGSWVALILKPGTAPLRSYVGEIAAVGECGFRLTLVDWISCAASGFDLFVPWESITAALVATDLDGVIALSDNAERWQEQIAEGSA
jgi:hypothetical protein